MTEAEWLAATDPMPMLEFFLGRATDRKLRLFASAVCGGVDMIDRYVDGLTTFEEMAERGLDAARAGERGHAEWCREEASNVACSGNIRRAVLGVLRLVQAADGWDRPVGGPASAEVARCVFGNPCRSTTLDPAWLTSTAVSLARGIYDDRDFDLLPILADALEEAGCTDADILIHCRGPGPHVRGCWVIDLILANDELKPKSAEQAAQRVLALLVAVGKIRDPKSCVAWMKKHNLRRFLSRAEVAFVEEENPSAISRIEFGWRVEAMVSLLWALKALPEMPPLNMPFGVFKVEVVRAALKDPLAFVSNARLRSAQEISDMESKLCHHHRRVRDAELVGIGRFLVPPPDDAYVGDLHPGIVYERRYGLSWLVGWGEDWDNVPTGT